LIPIEVDPTTRGTPAQNAYPARAAQVPESSGGINAERGRTTTPHFDGYPMVLVRLAAIGIAELTELVTDAWLAQAPKTLVKAFLAEHP
jgi:hypothetical protein